MNDLASGPFNRYKNNRQQDTIPAEIVPSIIAELTSSPNAPPMVLTPISVVSQSNLVGRRQARPSAARDMRIDHRCGIDDAVELIGANDTELKRRLAQREVMIERVMGDLRGLVVADHGRERGDQHK
jgi:hypothetical protein